MRAARQKVTRPAVAVAMLAFGLAACGDDNGTSSASNLSGTVKVDGSSTVAPLTTAAAELFQAKNSGVRVTVGTSGTGGGFEKFCNNEIDISDASRAIKDEEKAACTKNGVSYEELLIANDALTVVVSKDNTWAECLTVDQLKKMWAPKSKINNWNQVDPKFPSEPLKLFGAGTDSGTFDFFTKEIVGEEGSSRTDYNPSEDDNVTVQGVAGSKGGLGYFGFTYFEENEEKLKALKIDDGKGCVAPSVETAQNGTYAPLSRPLFIYPSTKALARPEVLAFVEYFVENHEAIAEDALFVPLADEQEGTLKATFDKIKTATG